MYDFGGVEDCNKGVFRFKESFGGSLCISSGISFFR